MRLEARDLHVRLGARPVLAGLDFAARPGEMTAVIGPNGAGKTTLLRVLAGLLPPAAGAASLDGRPVAKWPAQELARALAYLPQERLVHWALSAPPGGGARAAAPTSPWVREKAPPTRRPSMQRSPPWT